jgi:hypothetical protein
MTARSTKPLLDGKLLSAFPASKGVPKRGHDVPWSVWNWLATNKRYSDSYHLKKIDRELRVEFLKVLKELDLLEEV